MKALRFVPFVFALPTIVSCGNNHSAPTQPVMSPTPPASAHTVEVGSGGANRFSDSQSHTSTSTIRAGQTVQWVWSGGFHSTTSGVCCNPDGRWDSGAKSSGTFSRTFPSAGSFPYFCSVHGSIMTGQVVVNP